MAVKLIFMKSPNKIERYTIKTKVIVALGMITIVSFCFGFSVNLKYNRDNIKNAKNSVEIYSPLSVNQDLSVKEKDALEFFNTYINRCIKSLDQDSQRDVRSIRSLLHKKVDKNGKIVLNYKSTLNEAEYLALKKLKKCQKTTFSHMKPQDIRYAKNALKKLTTEMIVDVYTGVNLKY